MTGSLRTSSAIPNTLPTSENMMGGRKSRRRSRGRSASRSASRAASRSRRARRAGTTGCKRGGTHGYASILKEAIVPFGLFAYQKKIQNKRHNKKTFRNSRKFRKFRKSRRH